MDTLLFDQDTCLLHSVALRLPDSVQLVNHHFHAADYLIDRGTLQLNSEAKFFRVETCSTSAYHIDDDTLFLMATGNANTFRYDFALTVFDDFSILFRKQRYAGWMLQQASSHLVSEGSSRQRRYGTSASKQTALRRYLGYFNEETAGRMEEEDPAIKEELTAFLAELDLKHDPQLSGISEGIANLLHVYFGIEAVRSSYL
ncbi:hypothetical protein [Hymenobacter negativus]|uniref:AraC family transcriptional regulator n=1 Tax=Hymenobacter negativus TaxID=2795026 RepID=A0ABS3QA28_9BACT|nr:hypothetical protein [Hymenobacter negativus]MBO2008105.1 hypothetical protein [Hymenobacter negativus]